jgi:hypothetical protein
MSGRPMEPWLAERVSMNEGNLDSGSKTNPPPIFGLCEQLYLLRVKESKHSSLMTSTNKKAYEM